MLDGSFISPSVSFERKLESCSHPACSGNGARFSVEQRMTEMAPFRQPQPAEAQRIRKTPIQRGIIRLPVPCFRGRAAIESDVVCRVPT